MKILAILFFLFTASFQCLHAKIFPTRLTCEYLTDPPVIDAANPRLSWVNIAEEGERGQIQTAWEIRVAGTREQLISGSAGLWSSGKVLSDQSFNVRYGGKPLVSGQECWWQVRVWDKNDKISGWSEPAFWRMGLLREADWKAKWIGPPWQGEEALPKPSNPGAGLPGQLPPPAPLLRKEFSVSGKVARAVAYVTGLGYFEFWLNGEKVGEDVLVPNQTNYGKRPSLPLENIPLDDNFREYRVMYLAYDVSDKLTEGPNVLGAILGNGFYNPAKYWAGSYGTPRFIMQLHISYDDGSEETVISDETWKCSESPILMDMVFYGEHYDARLEQAGWCSSGFKDYGWENAVLKKAPEGKMIAHTACPDRVMEVLKPVKTEKTGEGNYRIDFGQEISGWVHLKNMNGEAGRKIEIRYIHRVPSGENSYIMKGSGDESYHARFNWFVFREVEILNWPGELKDGQVTAEAVYTRIETSGKFKCSAGLLEDINRIWWRSQTDNMHGGIASDCPNRERSPYTGDGQAACVTVIHNFDARAFYNKWIHDIIGASNPQTGYVPNGAPWQPGCGGGVAWGAAICIMPWEFWVHYGDRDILRDSYEAMKGYVKYMLSWTDEKGIMFSQAVGRDGKVLRWMNLGDWMAPYKLPPDNMVHTFYLWYCADIISRVAGILGNHQDEAIYGNLAEKTRTAFMSEFYDQVNGTFGRYGGNIIALKMGVPEEIKKKVIKVLADDIKADKGNLDTGIFGTRFFFEVLSANGLHDLAFEAMNKRTMPSYGYWLEQGATTMWEQWDQPLSGNHPMFGGGIVWLYRNLAGMNADPADPGYRRIVFCPGPVDEITHCSYENLTPYGMASISWEKQNNKFFTEINVPVGSSAIIYLPCGDKGPVRENGRRTGKRSGIIFREFTGRHAVYEVGSGKYRFESTM
ncbi:MAG TPA: family 78 glycoside hydrolase catalytic domain [Bacteroidales bacterium]|jgi:alpha-L-rhamnosidase|nr:family 78 glycoside hydrolase catalytic domain [Bacteroidales bacterium]HQJ82728.1 family 78 glycoside hydrolase catalytic domain [Bacteroidales bacterium]